MTLRDKIGSTLLLFCLLATPLSAAEWIPIGPFGGAVSAVAMSPDGTTAWAGGASLFRSTDSGASWQPSAAGLPEALVVTLALDPSDSSKLWAGTEGVGVALSTDGGALWAATGLSTGNVFVLVIDPLDGNNVWAIVDGGLQRTQDGGTNWSPLSVGATGDLLALTLDASGDLYAGSDQGEVLKSSDDGDTWNAFSTGLPANAIGTLAADPSTAGRIYAGIEGDGVYLTTNAGTLWSDSSTGLADLAVLRVVTDPSNASVVWALTEAGGPFRSSDGGANWAASGTGTDGAVVVDLVIDSATSSQLIAGSEGQGVFRSTDSGSLWAASNTGLGLAEIANLAMIPEPAEGSSITRIYAAGPDAGVFLSENGGADWNDASTGLSSLRLEDLTVDPADSDRAWVASDGGGVDRTVNAGTLWTSTSLPEVEALAVEFANDGTLYAGTDGGDGLYRSEDSGASWNAAATGLTDNRTFLIAADPHLPSRLFSTNRDGLFRTLDSAASWAPIDGGLGLAEVLDLAFTSTVDEIWAGTDLGVYHSIDGGATWTFTGAASDPATLSIAVDAETLWIATELSGVFRSSDGGTTFLPAGDGMATSTALDLVPDGAGRLYAGSTTGVFLYEPTVFIDGFESGNTSAWTAVFP